MEHDAAGDGGVSYAGMDGARVVRRRDADGAEEPLAAAPGEGSGFGWGVTASEQAVRNLARAILWRATGADDAAGPCEDLLCLTLRAFGADFTLSADWMALFLAKCREPGMLPSPAMFLRDEDELPQP